MKVQLVARDSHGKRHIINDKDKPDVLDQIVERNDGIMWIGSECCDLKVEYLKD